MDKDKLLKELRAQRELIQRHLEWIEQKIAAYEDGHSPVEKKSEQPAPEPNAETSEVEGAEPTSAFEEDEHDNDAEKAFKTYKPPSGNDVQRAKVGCLLLFIFSIALFLFLLFGLPHLLIDSPPDDEQSSEQTIDPTME